MTTAVVLLAWLLLVAVGFAVHWVRRLRDAEGDHDRLAEQLNRRLSELFSLQELVHVLSDSLELDRIVQQVTRYAMRFLDAEGSAIALVGSEGEPLVIETAVGTLGSLRGRQVPSDDPGLILRAIGREEVEVLLPGSGKRLELVAGHTVQCAAAAPMRAHGVTVGALVVSHPRGGSFTHEGLRLLTTVAMHTAIVVAHSRFFELIRQSKEQWETAFDALAEGVAVVDTDGLIRRANRALAELAKESLPELVGTPLTTALAHSSASLTDLLDAARRGERKQPRTLRSDGLGRVLRVTAAPIVGSALDQAVVVLVGDVTEQQALEAKLIQNEKLVAVGQLASGLAHELNNPLTSVAGLAELLDNDPTLSDSAKGHAKVIHEQAERASRIVQNLLTFARKGPPETTDVDLNDIVQRTLMLMQHHLKVGGVNVQRSLDAALPPVRGDRYELQQVFVNLLTNAAHAVSELPVESPRLVSIETSGDDDRVVVRVCDNGVGIPDDLVDDIFTPLFTTKRPGHGTGLGLWISLGIVEAHGGSLTLQRRPGETRFVIDLPAGEPVAAEDADRLAEDHKAIEGPPRRVLLIDDDPGQRRFVKAFFTQEGHAVDAVPAAQGVAAATKERYDLVMVDTRAALPSGESVLEILLRDHPDLKQTLVAAVDEIRPNPEAGFRALGVAFVRKPINLRDLRRAAQQLWSNAAGKR